MRIIVSFLLFILFCSPEILLSQRNNIKMRDVLFKHVNKTTGDIFVETQYQKRIRDRRLFSAPYEKARSKGHSITKLNPKGRALWSFEIIGDSHQFSYAKTDSLNNLILVGRVEDISGLRIKDDTLTFTKRSKELSSRNEYLPFIISISETGELNWYKFFQNWQTSFIDLNIRNGNSIVCTIQGNFNGKIKSGLDSKIWKSKYRNYNHYDQRVKTFQLDSEGKLEYVYALPEVVSYGTYYNGYRFFSQKNGNYLIVNLSEFDDIDHLNVKTKNKEDKNLLCVESMAYFSKSDSLLWVKAVNGIYITDVSFIDDKIHFAGSKTAKITGDFDLTLFPTMEEPNNQQENQIIYGILNLDGELDFITMSKYTWLADDVGAVAIEESSNGFNYLLTENLWKRRHKLYPPDDIIIGTKRTGVGSQLSIWKGNALFLFTNKTTKVLRKELKSRITTFQIKEDLAYFNYKAQFDPPDSDVMYFLYGLYERLMYKNKNVFYRRKLKEPKYEKIEYPNKLDYKSNFIDSLQFSDVDNYLENIKLIKTTVDKEITIQLQPNIEYTITLFQLKNRKKVKSFDFTSTQQTYSFNIEDLNSGLYFLELTSVLKSKACPFKIERINDK